MRLLIQFDTLAMFHSAKKVANYIKNVLHVRTIKTNLVSIGQIFEQWMQVQFNQGYVVKISGYGEKAGWNEQCR